MGNSTSNPSRGGHDDTVDFGHLSPQGVYTGSPDWNQAVVAQLIVGRRLAPFYRPLEDYEESWDDDQILAARKELPTPDAAESEQTTTRIEATATATHTSRSSHGKRTGNLKDPAKPEAAVYRNAVECPICFLYYPPNINHSRCCDQAICTECFVQIKRSEPTATHLVSDPACCPYCVQENFGVSYIPPPWRAGIGSDASNFPWSDSRGSPNILERPPYPTHKRRQKSFGADSPEVVSTDQIRPDWEAKLAAVRATVARRANRRIIMRQVGDRLIPVGVTSGRVHALSPEEAAAAENADPNGTRRSRRRQQGSPAAGLEQYIGIAGQDLEEMMIMEAMRLSLLDHEEQQRKEAEEKRKAAANEASSAPSVPVPQVQASTSSSPAAASSSAPVHRSSNSLQAGRPSFFSRSRSPSPAPGASSGNSSGHARKSSNTPAFSTLSAALSTTSTASAFLAGSSAATSSPVVTEPIPEPTASTSPVPVITVKEDVPVAEPPPVSPSVAEGEPTPKRLVPASLPRLDSSTSIDSNTADTPSLNYEPLASSPESLSPFEPLIDNKSSTDASSTPTPESQSLPPSH